MMSRLIFYMVAVVLCIAFYLPGEMAEAQEINFCSMPLSPGLLQAHASFNAIYEFDIAENGSPTNIKPVSKQFTKLADVQACLQKWSLPKAASKHLVAVFEWQHGVGWTTLSISGPDIKLTIRLSGQRCPYCPTQDGLQEPLTRPAPR